MHGHARCPENWGGDYDELHAGSHEEHCEDPRGVLESSQQEINLRRVTFRPKNRN